MNLDQFTIGPACLDENKVYLGKLDKKGRTWLHKKDITQQFVNVMISYIGENMEIDFVDKKDGSKYIISCKKIQKKN